MNTNVDNATDNAAPARNPRGKYVTLAVLLVWVAAVITFTFFKFSGGNR